MVKYFLQKSISNFKNRVIPNTFAHIGYYIFILVFCYILAYALHYVFHYQAQQKSNNRKIIYELVAEIAFYSVILFGILTVVINVGINISTLVVILGSVGLALALALQNSMRNMSAGVMILLLDYYDIGDLIQIDDKLGYVDSFNLFVTTIKDTNDVLIKIPNNTITEGVLTNYYKNKDIFHSFIVSISNADKSDNIDDICGKIKDRLIAECEFISDKEKVLVIVIDMSAEGTRLEIFIPVESKDFIATKWSAQLIVRNVITENNLNLLDYYYKDGAKDNK